MRRVLVVEDDLDIARLVQLHLRDIQCVAHIATTGIQALEKCRAGDYQLVILDLMLPGLDGISVCQQLRNEHPYVPILMLTAKSTEIDRVVGLEMGADDYVVKPFSIPELLARVKELLRRVYALSDREPKATGDAPLLRGPLSIHVAKRRVCLEGKEVSLTAREFDLLVHFARHPGRVYTRPELLARVWGYSHQGYEHTVNTHINRLRAKIEDDPGRPRHIITVWGVGYKFAEIDA